jgi:hypothetical protein
MHAGVGLVAYVDRFGTAEVTWTENGTRGHALAEPP